jgi:hypothetical protein
VHLTTTRPTITVTADGAGVVSHVGSRLLSGLADRSGLTEAFSDALDGLRERRAGHDPGRVLTDLVVLLADGGRSISDLAVLRDQSTLFGPVASTATAWRVLDKIDAAALTRVRAARASARERLWDQRAETAGPIGGHLAGGRTWPGLRIMFDATLVTAHSDKELAAANFKGGYGFHPLTAWLDNTDEALAAVLRPGNAGSNTATGAPRGASLYPQLSWEELGGRFLGLMAYLDPKGEGDNSMPLKQWLCPDIRDSALWDPRDTAKAILPES